MKTSQFIFDSLRAHLKARKLTLSDNNKLSLDRAKAVRSYLQNNGFPNVTITVEGKGPADLIVPLSDCPASGQAQIDCLAPNRRVIVDLYEKSAT